MSHKALYRTWRPTRFSEVAGQDHIVKVLVGQIESGRIAHAYLFSGPRGTGKTSLAKIFARAVNCAEKTGAEPCGLCALCREISASGGTDIIEIDAASNNGVDNVRDLRDRVSLLPAMCRYKVYIIDEVHMLSAGAFNALLKTLEEPPPHVIFILATTEVHKLPATIRSRCQRFDFKRISVPVIAARLAEVCGAEGYAFDPSALDIIARAAEGGMRDALSILDQCVSFGDITPDNVAAVLGGGDAQMIVRLAGCIAVYDEKGALEQLRALLDAGADTRTLIRDLADIFRRMTWLSAGAAAQEADEPLKAFAAQYGKNACVRALEVLIRKEYEMRLSLRADLVLETAVMALMAPEDDLSSKDVHRIEKLEARIGALENSIPAGGEQPPQSQSAVSSERVDASKPARPVKPDEKPAVPKKPNADKKAEGDANVLWKKMLDTLKKDAYFIYSHAQLAKSAALCDGQLDILFDTNNQISADYLNQDAVQKSLLGHLKTLTPVILTIRVAVEKKTAAASSADTGLAGLFGTDIEEI